MSIPYLPGWWDMLNQNGAVTNVVKNIDKRMRPDAYANQNLQQAIQQNPMLLDQISNMDPTQRQMLASGFGFKNANPFGGIAEGQKIKNQREMDNAVAGLTNAQRTERSANLAGTRTDAAIQREAKTQSQEDQKFDWAKQLNGLNFQKLTGDFEMSKLLNGEKTRAINALNEARKTYPDLDIDKVVTGLMTGKLDRDTMGQLQVMSGDEYLSSALGTIMDFAKLREQSRLQFGLRAMSQRDDFGRLALGAVENARKQLSDSQRSLTTLLGGAALSKINIDEAKKADPTRASMIDEAVSRMNEAQTLLGTYQPIVNKFFGVQMPVPETTNEATATQTETPEQRKARLKKAAGIP